jgi:DNA-binding transcriptional MerR regulator
VLIMPQSTKSDTAFRTIGEVAAALDLPQHILRYWETRFSQLRPMQRAGGRRYYRPEDIALVRRINQLLNQEGYTVKGVQKLLAEEAAKGTSLPAASTGSARFDIVPALTAIRNRIARALAEDDVAARI